MEIVKGRRGLRTPRNYGLDWTDNHGSISEICWPGCRPSTVRVNPRYGLRDGHDNFHAPSSSSPSPLLPPHFLSSSHSRPRTTVATPTSVKPGPSSFGTVHSIFFMDFHASDERKHFRIVYPLLLTTLLVSLEMAFVALDIAVA